MTFLQAVLSSQQPPPLQKPLAWKEHLKRCEEEEGLLAWVLAKRASVSPLTQLHQLGQERPFLDLRLPALEKMGGVFTLRGHPAGEDAPASGCSVGPRIRF